MTATGRSLAGFAVVLVDAPEVIGVRPYLGAGLGAASIAIADITFGFPAKGPSAETVVKGGTSQSLATLLTAGVAIPLSDRIALASPIAGWIWAVSALPGNRHHHASPAPHRLGIGGTQVDLNPSGDQASLSLRRSAPDNRSQSSSHLPVPLKLAGGEWGLHGIQPSTAPCSGPAACTDSRG